MNRLLTASLALLISSSAMAAAPKFAITDNSSEALIKKDVAEAIWNENLVEHTVKISKLYPVKKFGYISEVNGGFDASKNCVVVARAMLVPMNGKSFIYKPKQTSVAFGTQAGASAEQCSALAKAKLSEAVKSIVFSLFN